MTRLLCVVIALAGPIGCRQEAGSQPPPDPVSETSAQGDSTGGYTGVLVDTAEMGAPFMARQRVTAIHGDEQHSFEAVLQLSEGVLTMVALTPFGTKAFVLEQRGREVTFTKLVERELPFEPEYILLDIHRALFMSLGPAKDDGVRTGEREGEQISEEFSGGRLRRRVFRRLDGAPPGEIAVEFPRGAVRGEPPEAIEFDNGWFGYKLKIITLSWQPLT